ncbi:hypothetical protein V8F20_005630 [Naviculisporaceae sp. PSN 640]
MTQLNNHQLFVREEDNPNKTTKAGITLAIILGTTVGGLSLIFAVMGLWLYMRYKRLKRERAAAAAAPAGEDAMPVENRKSADTMIDYSREIHELNDLSGSQPDGSKGSPPVRSGNGEARTTAAAL